MKRATIVAMATLASMYWSVQAASALPQANKGAQAAPQTQQPAAAAKPAVPTGKRQPMAKTQDEFNEYTAIVNQQDPTAAEKAAAEFVLKYPESELRAGVYQML